MDKMAPATAQADPDWPELRQQRRAIVVVDVVESVRLMQANEADVIDRWRRFVNEVRTQVLPVHAGRLVKSLGDGMLLEFGSARDAGVAALEIQRRVVSYNDGYTEATSLFLRIGMHVADVLVDELDIYGSGVNLAARLASLAASGETIVSALARVQLVADLDVDVEDLGECFVKHLDQPVHAYRVGPPGGMTPPVLSLVSEGVPVIAVIPPVPRPGQTQHQVWGDVLADEVIAGLSKSIHLRVISRLSTAPFSARAMELSEVARRLRVDYVLSGSFVIDGELLAFFGELCDARTGAIVLSARARVSTASLLSGAEDATRELIASISHCILSHEVFRIEAKPLPTLASHSLMLAAVTGMHQVASKQSFDRAFEALEHLADRHPRHGSVRAWMGKWHVMQVVQGWAPDPRKAAIRAQQSVREALALEPANALAMTIEGQVSGFLFKDLVAAERSHRAALAANPNEPLAWIYTANLQAWSGNGQAAFEAANRARQLSPLDPLKYYYDSLAAAAMLSAGMLGDAIATAESSLRANRTHTATYRCLVIAQALAGQDEAAVRTAAQLMRLEPTLTVARFRERYPGREHSHAAAYADALLAAGIPAG